MEQVNQKELGSFLTEYLSVGLRRALFLHSNAGLAKSAIVKQVADSIGLELIDRRLSLMEPIDLIGFPYRDGEVTRYSRPSWLPMDGNGILFLDEFNLASTPVQSASYELILDRRIGDYRLPDGWVVMAAGNFAGSGCNTTKMSKALANRFIHLEVVKDKESWADWARGSDIVNAKFIRSEPLPVQEHNGIHGMVLNFMEFRPELLHVFDAKSTDLAWPSYRTWEYVSEILHANISERNTIIGIKGSIGMGTGIEFVSFLKNRSKIPSSKEILSNPMGCKIPIEIDVMYALMGMIGQAIKKSKKSDLEAFCCYVNRLPREFQVVFYKQTLISNPAIENTNAWKEHLVMAGKI